MKTVLHWFACHTVLIVLSVFIAVAIFFRGPLFGIWPQIEVVKAEPVQVAPVREQPVTVKPVKTIRPKLLPEPIAKKVIPLSEPKYKAVEKEVLVPEKSAQEKPAPAFRGDPVEIKLEDAPDISESMSELNGETAQELQNQQNYQFRPPEEQPVATPDAKSDLLQQARKAYWNDELDKARRLYDAYIELNPENPDGYGEQGNLLSTIGELDSAARMYEKAAELLLRQGKTEQAAKLNEVLNSIEIIRKTTE